MHTPPQKVRVTLKLDVEFSPLSAIVRPLKRNGFLPEDSIPRLEKRRIVTALSWVLRTEMMVIKRYYPNC